VLFESLEQIADEGGVPKILVIEDDPDLARTLIASFERFGLIVDHAGNGRQAVEIAIAMKPNLIILDLALPDLDGFGVVQALRNDKALCHVPVVVYSGAEVAPDRRHSLELGPTEFLIKSRISPRQFEEKVMGLLGILAAGKENAPVEAHSDR
jgi:DNA-binding response OmpR family regulator